ncbi:MAG: proline dehydrogenase, partial [Sciscionella sp.]
MLRSTLLAAARSTTARRLVESSPLTKPVVARFIAGDCLDDALRTASGLAAKGLRVTLDHLGEDTSDLAAARSTTAAYEQLFARLGAGGLA